MPTCCTKKIQTIYRPRKPEKTVLFGVIKKHYKTWRKNSEEPVPHYIANEFDKYLGCGILAKGFACAHCDCCNKDFFIAFSCKGRGICPSCNTRAMVETAANLIENVIPFVPTRQFVISFPKRIRHYLQTHSILQAILKIVIDEISKRLLTCSSMPSGKIGAISFIQQFGNTLNFHPHFHLIVADGIFTVREEQLLFHEVHLTPDDIADTQDCIQKRALNYFRKRKFFEKEAIEKMLSYENSGFSLDAKVRIPSWDREGLERLIRYCARPSFASENLRWNGSWINYRLPKPTRDGKRFIQIEPLELIERISKFIPYPRRHRRHYHGIFAPYSPLRKMIVARKPRINPSQHILKTVEKVDKISFNWAKLIARIYEINPLICSCGKEIKIIGFVTNPLDIRRILNGIGWPTEIPEFDAPYDLSEKEICQLTPGTSDGFPEEVFYFFEERGPDPPFLETYDPPHPEDCDPPHWIG